MYIRPILVVLTTLLAATPALAAGDAAAGKAKAAACAGCHGADGNAPSDAFPKLAGQHAEYVSRQLHLFKSGGRQNAIMAGMAAGLSDQDVADVAAYFESQTRQPGAAEESKVSLGQALYRGGDAENGIPACMACHAPDGAGNGPAGYPALSGQHAAYVAAKLKDFRKGTVWGQGDDANKIMATVAKHLTDEQIDAVSSYVQGLH